MGSHIVYRIALTLKSTRKTEEKLDGRNKEGRERKKLKWRRVGR